VYPPECAQRIEEDRAGYTHFAPTLLTRDGTTRWLRDLQARDTLIVTLDDGPLWLLRRAPDATPPMPALVRLDRDSVHSAWYESASGRDAGDNRAGR
jgi:hypothetical protein